MMCEDGGGYYRSKTESHDYSDVKSFSKANQEVNQDMSNTPYKKFLKTYFSHEVVIPVGISISLLMFFTSIVFLTIKYSDSVNKKNSLKKKEECEFVSKIVNKPTVFFEPRGSCFVKEDDKLVVINTQDYLQ